MGSCVSKNNSRESINRRRRTSASAKSTSLSSANKKKQLLHDEHKNNLNQVAINWKSNTIGIWKRSHEKLAIHTDVPRLGHKIDIVDKLDRLADMTFPSVAGTSITINTLPPPTATGESSSSRSSGEVASGGASDESSKYAPSTTLTSHGITTSVVLKKEEVVLQMLLTLAQLLDGPEKAAQIKEQYTNYIKSSGDISQQLLALLSNVVTEQSRMIRLLKACHQKIILPAYYFIKANLFEDLPFRDKRGSWRMQIVFEEDGSMSAVHSKRQQSTAGTDAEPEFEFEWTLAIIYDKNIEITALKVDVVDLIISKNIAQDKRELIQHAFNSLQLATTVSNNSGLTAKNNQPIPLNKIPDA
ncbi:hypothetical protein SAMD00019534_079240 [Acytostelium subglobosum LB1]|uniref:hypothetical protein n=1 Tax=Acytostelium subglobosum LB1 TaxID=1410327 RepID=UPI000644A03C|nr:hypothetical protein SAMD00019534_079240 [Acytostelium subglobosum LB1]GAM24749.1 hypothetical protein SAMD00019534_079240 [Acytostelium subglobosum LB1]|eukprot:XP_012752418.1 hypothetical protein SAMD00019534_079240 [Acytostelium subglobosum LB1]